MKILNDPAFRAEAREDYVGVGRVMAAAHDRFHSDPFHPTSWNKCEDEPCHSVCVLLGDVAMIFIDFLADETGRSA